MNRLLLSAMSTNLRRSSRKVSTTPVAATVAATSKATPKVVRARGIHADACAGSSLAQDEAAGSTTRPKKRARGVSYVDPESLEDEPEPKPPSKPKKARKKAGPVVYDVNDFPKRPDLPWKIGPHVSAAGGVENAVVNAASIGCVPHFFRALLRV